MHYRIIIESDCSDRAVERLVNHLLGFSFGFEVKITKVVGSSEEEVSCNTIGVAKPSYKKPDVPDRRITPVVGPVPVIGMPFC